MSEYSFTARETFPLPSITEFASQRPSPLAHMHPAASTSISSLDTSKHASSWCVFAALLGVRLPGGKNVVVVVLMMTFPLRIPRSYDTHTSDLASCELRQKSRNLCLGSGPRDCPRDPLVITLFPSLLPALPNLRFSATRFSFSTIIRLSSSRSSSY